VNNNAPAQDSGLSRPIGMKKAKKLEKWEGSSTKASIQISSASFGFENPFLAHMSAVSEDLVTAFKDNTCMKRKDLHAKRQNKQMGMAEMIISCGEKGKALAILSKIQEDDDLLSLARNADIPSAIEVECHTVNGSTNNMDKGNVNDDENLDSFQTPNERSEQGNNEYNESKNHEAVRL
jgi:hypothetical protein